MGCCHMGVWECWNGCGLDTVKVSSTALPWGDLERWDPTYLLMTRQVVDGPVWSLCSLTWNWAHGAAGPIVRRAVMSEIRDGRAHHLCHSPSS